ncbi:MAG: hypothetical protein ACFE8U_01875 [Candidatus Hermodarchaeota archaeon]
MYNKDEFKTVKVVFNDSKKRILLMGLFILLILSTVGIYFIFIPTNIEGKDIGHFLVPLIVISEIPLLSNYFFLVIFKFSNVPKIHNAITSRITKFFTFFYPIGLIFHSIIYTIIVGLVLNHTLLVMQKATLIRVLWVNIPYCVIFILIVGLIWIMEFLLWTINWPLYPKNKPKVTFLYWSYWFLLFSTSIFTIFHSGTFSQSIPWGTMIIVGYMAFVYITLIWIIFRDVHNLRMKTQSIG